MAVKASSLKEKDRFVSEQQKLEEEFSHEKKSGNKNEDGKIILRKYAVPTPSSGQYSLVSTFSHKNDACVYYPKVPRSWMPDGLIIIPCLSDKGVRGAYDLDVYCSEPIKLTHLPDNYSRVIAGEWTEATAGGSHICHGSWKKNGKYSLKLRGKSIGTSKVIITLTRAGETWKSQCRADTVGCMIGFYIFTYRPNLSNPSK